MVVVRLPRKRTKKEPCMSSMLTLWLVAADEIRESAQQRSLDGRASDNHLVRRPDLCIQVILGNRTYKSILEKIFRPDPFLHKLKYVHVSQSSELKNHWSICQFVCYFSEIEFKTYDFHFLKIITKFPFNSKHLYISGI